jgi:hypothetical protein
MTALGCILALVIIACCPGSLGHHLLYRAIFRVVRRR